MQLIDKKGNVSEFDVGDTKIVSLKTKCLMVGEVNPTKKIKFKTTLVKLDAAEGFKIVTDKGTEIPLTSDIDKNISKLKTVGITSSTVANDEATDFYKSEDTDSPATIDVRVNFNFNEVVGNHDTSNTREIILKYNRKDNPVTLKEVIADVVKNEEFKTSYAEFASQLNDYAISGAYKLGSGDKKITVRANSKILQDVDLYLTWKEKEESSTTDEFEYTKVPGKISKIFFHVGKTKEIAYNGDADDVEDRTTILNLLQLEEGQESTFVFVDADGVVRYEFGKLSDTFIKDDDSLLSSVYGICKAVPDKTFVVDCDITIDSTVDDIINSIATNSKLVAELSKYDGRYADDTENWYIDNINVLSSDLLYTTNFHTDSLRRINDGYSGIYAPAHFSNILLNTSEEEHKDQSMGFKGVYIIEKAIHEGRALDLFLSTGSVDD